MVQERENIREYLNQLKNIDVCIKQKQGELAELKSFALCINVNTNTEKVQTSARVDRIEETIIKIISLENEVCSEIEDFTKLRHKIINEIQSLGDSTYINILFKKYVEYKTLEQIAFEMNYSYDRTKHLHGFALKSFEIRRFSMQ